MGSAMFIVGRWVSVRIENAVVQNSGNAAALYMESFISPLSQDLATSDRLSAPAEQALIEVFENTPLGDRVASYKIWKADGTIVSASDPEMVGRKFEIFDDLEVALNGGISAAFEDLDEEESQFEQAMGVPLLEVYSPIREVWSGEVIGVAEFYERADELVEELADARRNSWLVVGTTFAASALLLLGIVVAGDRVIARQERQLQEQLLESRQMAAQNADLRARVVGASRRATAQTDSILRRLGAELHDGPAQYLALAALRLDAVLSPDKAKARETEEVRSSLSKALKEIRALSRGLAIPDIERLNLRDTVQRAVSDHEAHSSLRPTIAFEGAEDPPLTYSEKLCVYRFVQETLSNAARYAADANCEVRAEVTPETLRLTVTDNGPGFVPDNAMHLRDDGGQGLMGLRDRIESLGGQFGVEASPGSGTKVTLSLPTRTLETP
jgi:signal transduction histidine kinase